MKLWGKKEGGRNKSTSPSETNSPKSNASETSQIWDENETSVENKKAEKLNPLYFGHRSEAP
jgi:hypothetical protein